MAIVQSTVKSINLNLSALACPYSELTEGQADGMHTALWEIRYRAEFLRLVAALERSRAAFLVELRAAHFVAEGGAAATPLDEFESLMFGPGAGGVHGAYASGFVSAFAVLAPFVASMH